MPKRESRALLGALDQYVLLAILRQHANAYGVSIRDEIETRTGVRVSTGAVYLSLERLEREGLVESRVGEPTAERGGRRKTLFKITGRGEDALNASLASLKTLVRGTPLKGAVA